MGGIDFKVHKNARCVHFTGEGEFSFDYLIQRIMDVHKHPDYDFTFNTFIDFKNATVPFDDGGIDNYRSFFEGLQVKRIHRKWAIYTKDETTFTSANMIHALFPGVISVDVFQK